MSGCTQRWFEFKVSSTRGDTVLVQASIASLLLTAMFLTATLRTDVLQVVAVLEQTRSSYLSTFLSLRKTIQQEAVIAEDNLKFLQCLEQPCKALATATAQVPSTVQLIQ